MKSRNRRATARRSAEDGPSVLMMTDRKGENMERLTQRSPKTGAATPSDSIGDICFHFCDCESFDFCEHCPVNRILQRLCEYEDTGLTPEQVELLTKPKLSKSSWTGKIFKNEEAAKALAEYNQGSYESYRKKCIEKILLDLGVEVNSPKNTAENIRSQAIKKLSAEDPGNKQQLSGNPQIRVNQVISYLAEKKAFDLRNGKLSIDDSKVPELQTEALNLKTMLIRRIKKVIENI